MTGADLEVVVGHLGSLMLVSRWPLSLLQNVYRFIIVSRFQRQPLWKSVRAELQVIRGILPLLRASIVDTISPHCFAFDACLTGYAVEKNTESDPAASLRFHERWRFRSESTSRVSARAVALAGDALHNPWEFHTVRSTLYGEVPRKLEPASNFPEIPSEMCEFGKWRTLWHAPLMRQEAIQVCECRGLVAFVRHCSRQMFYRFKDVLVLSDSMAVTLASDKGRSKDPALDLLMRRIFARTLVTGMRLRIRWIPSERNPADLAQDCTMTIRYRFPLALAISAILTFEPPSVCLKMVRVRSALQVSDVAQGEIAPLATCVRKRKLDTAQE